MNNQKMYHIAILDDVPSTLRMTRLILEENLPCRVSTFSKGEDILRFAAEELPDMFILDIQMEGLSGVEVCRQLKDEPASREIPVIFFSAHGSAESRVEALQSGGADYLDKPFYPEELIARARIHLELHRARLDVLKQKEEQEALLRVLCHDLQNPLGAAYSILELILIQAKPTEFTPKTRERITLARRAMTSGLDLIAHVREYRSLVDREQTYLTESVSLHEAFDEVLLLNQPRAEDKNIQLITNLPDADICLSINRTVLVHNLLNNLVSNALKFSFEGSAINLGGSLETDANGAPKVCLRITDQGIGMEPQTLRHLFDPAQNISRVGTRRETGTGFGMPLVKRYTDLFGGQLEISSIPFDEDNPDAAHGTTVSLYFPLDRDA